MQTVPSATLGCAMKRGRVLRWVAGDEALIASRRSPSVMFAIIEPSKEAHDSIVRVLQCRARSLALGHARGVRGAASPSQCPAPRATTTKPD